MAGQHPRDLDALLRRTAPLPPSGLQETALGRLAVARRSGRLTAAVAGLGGCLVLLTVFALLLGRAAAAGGAVELLALGVDDPAMVRTYPSDYLSALSRALPWLYVAGVALDLAVITLLTRYLLTATAARGLTVRIAR